MNKYFIFGFLLILGSFYLGIRIGNPSPSTLITSLYVCGNDLYTTTQNDCDKLKKGVSQLEAAITLYQKAIVSQSQSVSVPPPCMNLPFSGMGQSNPIPCVQMP